MDYFSNQPSHETMNTQEKNKDSGELTSENLSNVVTQVPMANAEGRNVYMITLSTPEWLVYSEDPESYRKQFEYEMAKDPTFFDAYLK